MGYVLGGIAAGVLIGYPLGGFMFEFFGESAPFVVVSFAAGALVGKTTGVIFKLLMRHYLLDLVLLCSRTW